MCTVNMTQKQQLGLVQLVPVHTCQALRGVQAVLAQYLGTSLGWASPSFCNLCLGATLAAGRPQPVQGRSVTPLTCLILKAPSSPTTWAQSLTSNTSTWTPTW